MNTAIEATAKADGRKARMFKATAGIKMESDKLNLMLMQCIKATCIALFLEKRGGTG
jgi:hypothetical protein